MSNSERAKFLLRRFRIFPKKVLGQNFMIEPSIFQSLADCASLDLDDVVLDIGAGLGFLTRFLADKCKTVLAVESDACLVEILREQLENLSNVRIIHGDVLKVWIPRFDKVISIPPYHISSRLLLWLFSQKFESAVLVFQKEFANRLVAPVGSKSYGWLSVVAYYYVEVELLDSVPKWMFYPQPKVDSVVVRLEPKIPLPFALRDETSFKQLAQTLFTHRNRKVRNAIVPFVKSRRVAGAKSAMRIVEVFSFRDKRVRELAPEDFGALANGLSG